MGTEIRNRVSPASGVSAASHGDVRVRFSDPKAETGYQRLEVDKFYGQRPHLILPVSPILGEGEWYK